MFPDSPSSVAPTFLDVAIVGSGPAGGAAALELAGRGLRVGIIEKATPPRYKTCGGGVLWRAVKALSVDIRSAVDRECQVAELVHHDPGLRFLCRRDHAIVSMVMRDRFDHLLIASALARGGVELHSGTTVRDVVVDAERVRLDTDRGVFAARYVIAADGVTSVIARKTNRPALRNIVPALECEVTYAASTMAPLMETARFDFGLVPAGYGWVFPKRDHLSIGVGTTRRGAANLPDYYSRYLSALGLPPPETEERHGYMIPCRPRAGMFELPRVLFVGDAAGLADPVTAEGITGAVLSGQLAARAIRAHDDVAAVQPTYEKTLHRALLADLRIARWLAWLLYERPRWCALLLSRQGAGMSELMTRIVCGETTYRAAVSRPGHYLRLFFSRARLRSGDTASKMRHC
jgi:geranylgeranyl reductase family protein